MEKNWLPPFVSIELLKNGASSSPLTGKTVDVLLVAFLTIVAVLDPNLFFFSSKDPAYSELGGSTMLILMVEAGVAMEEASSISCSNSCGSQ